MHPWLASRPARRARPFRASVLPCDASTVTSPASTDPLAVLPWDAPDLQALVRPGVEPGGGPVFGVDLDLAEGQIGQDQLAAVGHDEPSVACLAFQVELAPV